MFSVNSIIFTERFSFYIHIVDVHHATGQVAYFDLNTPQGKRKKCKPLKTVRVVSKPQVIRFEELQEILNGKKCQLDRFEFDAGVYVPQSLSPMRQELFVMKREEKALENYSVIAPLVENRDARFEYLYTDRGAEHINKISQATGVYVTQVYRLLSQFFQRGGVESAMYPNYKNCGRNYQFIEAICDEAPKRGRPSNRTDYRNVTEEDRDNIRTFLKKLGKRTLDKRGYQNCYEIYDFKFQSQKVEIEGKDGCSEERIVSLPRSECISYSQFYHYVKRVEKDVSFKWSKRDKNYLENYENRLGQARDGVPGPAFRYEIDATREDIYLAFPYRTNQRLSSGRPIVYRVICVYSSMVVGFHVSFEGPNWKGVLQALLNAFSDKVEFCKQYGIDIAPEEWPCMFTCDELTMDNGVEYPRKQQIQMLMANIGIDVLNLTKIYAGEAKGNVEGGLAIDKNEVIQFMPGYVERVPERKEKHASNNALLSYKDFVSQLIHQALIRNNEVFNENLHDKAMAQAGIKATPLEVWNFGMRHYMNNGRGKYFDRKTLLFALLPSGDASTTEKGIYYKGLYYNCAFAASQGWLTSSKRRTVKKLDIRFSYETTNHIWYKFEGNVYTATLSPHSEKYEDVTWYDALHLLELYELDKVVQKESERLQRFKQKEETERIEKAALDRVKGMTKSKRKSAAPDINITQFVQQKILDKDVAENFINLLSDGLVIPKDPIKIESKERSELNNFNDMYGEGE